MRPATEEKASVATEREQLCMFHQRFDEARLEDEGDALNLFNEPATIDSTVPEIYSPVPEARRSSRERHANPRYFNINMDNR